MYSIDESFIGIRGTVEELIELGHRIRADVLRRTGIPVRVGIGRTKTLAKLASRGAKALPELEGVCHLGKFTQEHLDRIMDGTNVDDLWGVASRTRKRLAPMNIHTAKDLRDAEPKWIRKKFSVVLERTVMELRGVPCIPLEEPRKYKDELIYSRMFSAPITTEREMRQVLSIYAQKVSTRLRKQGQVAGVVSAGASTAWHTEGPRHTPYVSCGMPVESDDPIGIGKAAGTLLPHLIDGTRYVRACVILTGLRPQTAATPLALFQPAATPLALFQPEYEGRRIGDTLDRITAKLGPDAIGVGLGGMQKPPGWAMRREMLSRRATTHWDELCEARA